MTGAAPEVSPGPEVAAAIAALVAARPPLLVVADFDGTLATGSRDPAAATIEPLAQRALRALVRRSVAQPGRLHLAILTGRTVADVVARVRVGGLEYLGDHGLQGAVAPRGVRPGRLTGSPQPGFEGYRDPAELLATGVAATLGDPPWLFVERKGPSVAFHVRQADDVPVARAAVLDAIVAVEQAYGLADHGLLPYRGRSVVDLRPEHAGGKREAMERLIERHDPGGVVVLGDELSDVDAFEAVVAAGSGIGAGSAAVATGGGVRRGPPVAVTVAVHAHGGRPAPAELLELASVRLASPHEVGRFLSALGRELARAG